MQERRTEEGKKKQEKKNQRHAILGSYICQSENIIVNLFIIFYLM